MDDCGHIMYYVKGRKLDNPYGPFIMMGNNNTEYYTQIAEWCKQCIGPHKYGWHIKYDEYQPNIVEYIAIAHSESVTLFKLAFPDAYIVHSLHA